MFSCDQAGVAAEPSVEPTRAEPQSPPGGYYLTTRTGMSLRRTRSCDTEPESRRENQPRSCDPSEAILHAAHEQGADVIVVGSHERGWFSRLLSGSVSQDLVRRSDIPVLVVK